jgi:excisionase family DNA binding protein
MDVLMTVGEIANYLKLNRTTIYKLAQQGRIPASKVGGSWRFDKAVIDQWLAHQFVATRRAILVVDDDPRVREALGDIITDQGHEVVAVATGEEAIQEFARQRFDLVFLDLILPGVTGLQVFETIRQHDSRALVVIITGYADYSVAEDAMALGPLLLIRKPFRASDIVHILDMVKSKRPARFTPLDPTGSAVHQKSS